MLVGARAVQGVFAAMLAPAALSLLVTTFTDPQERAKAFGVFGAIAGAGGAFGLLLGGALAEVLDWRACLYVSIAFAAPAAVAAVRLLHHVEVRDRPRLDIPGTLAASSGVFALVFGFSQAKTDGWGDPVTLGLLGAGALLLAAFVAIQRRAAHPLLPLRVVADRNRGGSFLAVATAGAGIFGVFLFLTFYLQNTKGFSPLETGLAFLPLNVSVIAAATTVSTRLLPRTGPRPLVTAGMASAAAGMVLLTGIGPDTPYASHVLPSLVLIGLGFGMIIASSLATATFGVQARDSGVASAMVSTSQQVGGSIGTALLSTMAASAAIPVDGYVTAFWWAAGIFAAGALVCGTLLRSDARPAALHGAPEPA
jgi:MFS family permease